jgi:hypothetical protein
MKLKLGITFSALGVLFYVHRTTISRIFFNILSFLVIKTSAFIFWPSKKTIQETLPEAFKTNFPECPGADPDRDNGWGGKFLTDTHDIDIYIDKIKNINFDICYLFK